MFRFTVLVTVITIALVVLALPPPSNVEEALSLIKRGNRNDGSQSYQVGTGNDPGVPVGRKSFIQIGEQVWDNRHTSTQDEAEVDKEEYQDAAEEFHGQGDEEDLSNEDGVARKVVRGQVSFLNRPLKPQSLKFSSTGRQVLHDEAGKVRPFRKEGKTSQEAPSSSTYGGSSAKKDKKPEVALLHCDPHAFI